MRLGQLAPTLRGARERARQHDEGHAQGCAKEVAGVEGDGSGEGGKRNHGVDMSVFV